MKLVVGKQVYDQLPPEEQALLKAIACSCLNEGTTEPDPDCESCLGGGTVWEDPITPEQEAAILENLIKQGVPVKKLGN